MNLNYLLCLYEQFCKALGKSYSKQNIFTDLDFFNWLSILQKQTRLYGEYLKYLDILDRNLIVELDKGKYDTIGTNLVTIISPFASSLGLQNSNIIVKDIPLVLRDNKIYYLDSELILTHNPYSILTLNNLISLHNMGLNICLGVYGSNLDKDKKDKLTILKNIFKRLNDDIEISYDTLNDTYFGIITSKRYVKTKELVRR